MQYQILKSPYLIQRMRRTAESYDEASTRFGEMYALDYMGAAEYEFGAVAKCLRKMNAEQLTSSLHKIAGCHVTAVYPDKFSKESIQDYLQTLCANEGYGRSGRQLKEASHFCSDTLSAKPKRSFTQTDSWLDLEQDIFFTKSAEFNKLLKEIKGSLKNSVTYMDTRK